MLVSFMRASSLPPSSTIVFSSHHRIEVRRHDFLKLLLSGFLLKIYSVRGTIGQNSICRGFADLVTLRPAVSMSLAQLAS